MSDHLLASTVDAESLCSVKQRRREKEDSANGNRKEEGARKECQKGSLEIENPRPKKRGKGDGGSAGMEKHCLNFPCPVRFRPFGIFDVISPFVLSSTLSLLASRGACHLALSATRFHLDFAPGVIDGWASLWHIAAMRHVAFFLILQLDVDPLAVATGGLQSQEKKRRSASVASAVLQNDGPVKPAASVASPQKFQGRLAIWN